MQESKIFTIRSFFDQEAQKIQAKVEGKLKELEQV